MCDMDDILPFNADGDLFTDSDSSERRGIYQIIAERFNIKTALYPGCGLDIALSLFIPNVVYLDSSPESSACFEKRNRILDYISAKKTYTASCEIAFYASDYLNPPELPQFDLLVSQYAGNVGQEMKRFLKPGGVLLVAEGPADFDLALHDPDYELLGTILTEHGRTKFLQGMHKPIYVPIEMPDFEDDNNQVGMRTHFIPLTRNFCFRKKQTDCGNGSLL